MKRLIVFASAILISLFVAFVWWRADLGNLSATFTALYHFPYGDKTGHFLLMGLLTFFVYLPSHFNNNSRFRASKPSAAIL